MSFAIRIPCISKSAQLNNGESIYRDEHWLRWRSMTSDVRHANDALMHAKDHHVKDNTSNKKSSPRSCYEGVIYTRHIYHIIFSCCIELPVYFSVLHAHSFPIYLHILSRLIYHFHYSSLGR